MARCQSFCCRSRGSVAFLVAAVLPLLFLFGFLLIEMRTIFLQRQVAQELADGASLLAAQNLPFTNLATSRARHYLSLYGVPENEVELTVDGSSVGIRYAAQATFTLARFFGAFDETLKIPVRSKAALAPRDVVIFVDVSSYMGPSILSAPRTFASNDTAWGAAHRSENGEEISFWPSAQLFQRDFDNRPFFPDPRNPESIAPNPPERLLTQQCFNPGLSAIKEAALRLYDYFSAAPQNSVGILAGPSGIEDGTAPPISVLRGILPQGERSSLPGEASFQFFRSRYASDEYCLAATESESRHAGYQVPPRSDDLSYFAPSGRPSPLVSSDVNHGYYLPQSHLAWLGAREVLWSLAARRTYPDYSERAWTVDAADAITQTGRRLLSAPNREERASLTGAVSRLGFILLGNVPFQAGRRFREDASVERAIREALQRLDQEARSGGLSLSLFLSFFKHPGSYPDCAYSEWGLPTECVPFLEDAAAFEAFAVTLNRELQSVRLYFMRVPDVSSLPQDYVSMAAMIGKTAVLVR